MTGDETPAADRPEVVTAEIVETTGDDAGVPDPHELGIELPDDPDAAVPFLLRELATSREEATSYLEDLRRVAADFENFRKRKLREQAEHVERASQRVVEALLPVLDSFDAAFTHEPQTPGEEKLVAGIRSTYHQLLDILGREGLEVIQTIGEPFDPEVHEAVTTTAEGDGELWVTAEMRRGYLLKGRVLRPALVAVGDA